MNAIFQDRTKPPSEKWACHAIGWLNIKGKLARADEFVIAKSPCRSSRYVWSPEDNAYICSKCLTLCREDAQIQFVATPSTKQELTILALQRFIREQKTWEIDSEKLLENGGVNFYIVKQASALGRNFRIAISCFASGTISIQGKDTPERRLLQSWKKHYKENNFVHGELLWEDDSEEEEE